MSKRTLVTAALPYANGPIHIGHIAGCYLPADIYTRFLRCKDEDVKFVCGSDEHGVPITIKARNESITPQQVVDRYHSMMDNAFKGLGISFDVYSRTSSEEHHRTASDFFQTLYDKGVFEERETEQYFDEEAKQFLADRYIIGTCPKCGHDGAYGDQCESCGASLNPTDLINPVSKLSGNKPVMRSTKNWFLPLQDYQQRLESFIGEKKGYWKSNVFGQCMSWLSQGLQSRAMTRDLNWGVPVPLKDAEGKVLYVWFDAPIGYITATKQLLANEWESYWKDSDSQIVHFIGKDNIVFHCIIFPAMLMAHGGYNLPHNVPANEFLNLEGQKISTSRNWAVWLHEYLEDLPNRQDELRYVLTSIAPETGDSEFTWSDYQARVNNELVAIFGNFVNRVLVLYQKYYDGVIDTEVTDFADERHANVVEQATRNIESAILNHRYKQALTATMEVARHGNRYLTETEPWKVFKTDPNTARVILNDCLLLMGYLRKFVQPFMPHTSSRLSALLGLPLQNVIPWTEAISFSKGMVLPKPSLLFSKVEDEQVSAQLEKLTSVAADVINEPEYEPEKDAVSFDDFTRMDLRVGEIISAEKVKKADKLLHLKVDVGFKTISLVSGIAEHHKPEEVVGKQVMVLLNLEPRKIRGVLSQGMILMTESADGRLVFMTPYEKVEPGVSIR